MEASQGYQEEQARRRLSPAWIAAGVIALLVLGLLGYALVGQPIDPPAVGGPVPNFQLEALDGTPMNLDAHRGEVVVLNFFASWCAPCRQEALDLEGAWRTYQDRGVQFFGIAYKDADSKAAAFLETFGVTYPSTVEPGSHTARAYGVTGVPETFIVDQQGLLVRHFLGPITEAQLRAVLDPLLGP
jgi:cytochrome c biogenesis protein CcmG/thiol:disulfide interchange protein DsbE